MCDFVGFFKSFNTQTVLQERWLGITNPSKSRNANQVNQVEEMFFTFSKTEKILYIFSFFCCEIWFRLFLMSKFLRLTNPWALVLSHLCTSCFKMINSAAVFPQKNIQCPLWLLSTGFYTIFDQINRIFGKCYTLFDILNVRNRSLKSDRKHYLVVKKNKKTPMCWTYLFKQLNKTKNEQLRYIMNN